MKLGILFSMVTILVLVGACGPHKAEAAKDDAAKLPVDGPKLVGRIASVPQEKGFVLIQSYGKWEGESGQILTTRGLEGRSANLKITGEKLAEFAAADLQSGETQVGDAVYSHHTPKPMTTPPSSEVIHLQRESNSENVQKNN